MHGSLLLPQGCWSSLLGARGPKSLHHVIVIILLLQHVLMNNTVCHFEPIFIRDGEKGTIILKVGAGAVLTPLLLPLERLLSSPVNYLLLERLMECELFSSIQVTSWGGIMFHKRSDWVQCHFACWQAHLKALLPFTKILSIMDQAKSIAVSSRSLWSHLITCRCSFEKVG